MTPRRAAAFGALALAAGSTAIILSAPRTLTTHPVAGQILFVALAAVEAVLALILFGPRGVRIPWPGRGATLLISSGLVCLPFFSGYYFSDDALRHIHDGWNILLGNNVYLRTGGPLPMPIEIPLPYDRMPTIYLPGMQLFTTAGAWLSPRYGFLLLFHLTTAALLAGLWVLWKGVRRDLLIFWALSTGLLMDVSGRHSDTLGVLFSLLGLTLIARGQSSIGILVGGLLAGLGVGFKPEGFIFASYAAFIPIVAYRKSWGAAMEPHRAILAWLGLLTGGAILVGFAFGILWREPGTFDAYRRTLRFFLDEWVAVNPVVLYRIHVKGMLNMMATSVWRKDLAVITLAVLMMLPGWILLRHAHAAGAPHKAWTVPSLWRGRLAGRLLYAVFLVCLAYIILVRGAWHPWYLEYVIGALIWGRRRFSALFLICMISIWYLPVPPFRAGGPWEHAVFFAALITFAGGWFLLTKRVDVLSRP
ncbi:MAG: hypothetical protein HY042_06310 [Spirochaetia bacterium]|nr:hypothetical protein [Spirochaetia bacterium]